LFSLCMSHHRFVLTTKVSETLRRLSSTTTINTGRTSRGVRIIASQLSFSPDLHPDGLSECSMHRIASVNSGGKVLGRDRGIFRHQSVGSCDQNLDAGWSPERQFTSVEFRRDAFGSMSYDNEATPVDTALPFNIAEVTVTTF